MPRPVRKPSGRRPRWAGHIHDEAIPSFVPRVLVADADERERRRYRETLTADTCDVIEADNGRDAVVKALVHFPDLIITELQLPLIDGVALCELVRRDRTTSRVPILVVTRAAAGPRHRAQRAGANAVLAKPALADSVSSEVRRLLAEISQLRGRAASAHRMMRRELERAAAQIAGAPVRVDGR